VSLAVGICFEAVGDFSMISGWTLLVVQCHFPIFPTGAVQVRLIWLLLTTVAR
jgi:hypothetical protein